MKDNIRTILHSNEKAEELKKQSESIREGGDLFSKNANELKKATCWQNWKLTIIIILIIIGALLAIIVPIVATRSSGAAAAEVVSNDSSTKASGTLRRSLDILN